MSRGPYIHIDHRAVVKVDSSANESQESHLLLVTFLSGWLPQSVSLPVWYAHLSRMSTTGSVSTRVWMYSNFMELAAWSDPSLQVSSPQHQFRHSTEVHLPLVLLMVTGRRWLDSSPTS